MAQGQPDSFNLLWGALTQIGDRTVFDLAAFPIGFAQEVAGGGLAVLLDRRDVDLHSGYNMATKNT
jgi:hypothetical protein